MPGSTESAESQPLAGATDPTASKQVAESNAPPRGTHKDADQRIDLQDFLEGEPNPGQEYFVLLGLGLEFICEPRPLKRLWTAKLQGPRTSRPASPVCAPVGIEPFPVRPQGL